MKVLGIETSCDETAVAIVDRDGAILSHALYSQVKTHQEYGGVVPEVAAREHIGHIEALVKQALQDASLGLEDIDGFAATCGPGLIGGVMIGMMMAKSLAFAREKPFIAVNHLEAHALTPRLTEEISFPYLLLLVSGGHSQILIVEGVGKYTELGTTLDDACGECFDKTARAMGLGHPGGPRLEALADQCTDKDGALKHYNLPKPFMGEDHCNFSFSGLKTAVLRHVEASETDNFTRLAYALQTRIADILSDRCGRAMQIFKEKYPEAHPHFVVSGGVAANKAIRSKLTTLCDDSGFAFAAPPLKLCTDNGVMVAWAGLERLRLGMVNTLDFKARPRWPLTDLKTELKDAV